MSDELLEAMGRLERSMAEVAERLHSSLPLVLTVRAAAAQLSISERTMRGLVASGEVASVLVGGRRMVPREELLRLAKPVPLAEVRAQRTARRVPRSQGMDLAAELEELSAVKRRRARG